MADEEYQYPDEGEAESSGASTEYGDDESKKSGINKVVLLPLLAILLAVIYTKFIAKKRDASADQLNQVKVEKTVQPASKQKIVETKLEVSTPKLDSVLNAANNSATSILEDKDLSELKDKVHGYDKKLGSVNVQMNEISLQLREMKGMVEIVNQKFLAMERAKLAKVTKVKVKSKPKFTLKYTTRALIDGRAWLVSSDGTTLSVSVGDTLEGGYGKVVAILPIQGIVTTSSGKNISLGQNDH
jgi:intracellular multiplication protein IcmG